MIILIEGADCTGKTTLSRSLLKILNFRYIKAKGPFNYESALEYTKENLEKCAREANSKKCFFNAIWERCPMISHLIYSPLIDHKNVEGEGIKEFRRYQEMFRKLKTVVVFCSAPLRIVEGRLEDDKYSQQYLKKKDIAPLLKKYEELMYSDYMSLPIVRVNTWTYGYTKSVCYVLNEVIKKYNEEYL